MIFPLNPPIRSLGHAEPGVDGGGRFAVEAKDRKVIADPVGAILRPGGRIVRVDRDGQAPGLSRRLLEACEA